MTNRIPLIAGNWKMNKTNSEAVETAVQLLEYTYNVIEVTGNAVNIENLNHLLENHPNVQQNRSRGEIIRQVVENKEALREDSKEEWKRLEDYFEKAKKMTIKDLFDQVGISEETKLLFDRARGSGVSAAVRDTDRVRMGKRINIRIGGADIGPMIVSENGCLATWTPPETSISGTNDLMMWSNPSYPVDIQKFIKKLNVQEHVGEDPTYLKEELKRKSEMRKIKHKFSHKNKLPVIKKY